MSTSINVPLDSDGFLRRECPNCDRQFKWYQSQEDDPVEAVSQYHCPLCGQSAGLDMWWTKEQLEHAKAAILPDAMREIQNAIDDSFKGAKNITFKASNDLGAIPVAPVLNEPDDMLIVEPPCHPSEPVKVPEDSTPPFHCLICGERYSA